MSSVCGRRSGVGQAAIDSAVSTTQALLPARASEQGNVIGLVSVYIYIYVIKKKL